MDNNAFFKIGYGLYVLTAHENEKDNGCIINTLMQITSNTPFWGLVSVNKQNFTHDMIAKTGVYNVNVLTTETPFTVFQQFGYQSGKTVNKFETCKQELRTENGVIYLPKYSNAVFSCKVLEQIDFGTHTIFKSEFIDAKHISDVETLTYTYYQNNVKPKPAEKKHGWRCKICGYVYEDDSLPADFICPICKHGAGDFEKI